jgi:hypothetical protein
MAELFGLCIHIVCTDPSPFDGVAQNANSRCCETGMHTFTLGWVMSRGVITCFHAISVVLVALVRLFRKIIEVERFRAPNSV